MATYEVKVRKDHRWSSVRVAGHNFSKAGESINEADLTDEIRNSPLLVVEEAPAMVKPKRKRTRRPKIEEEVSDPQSNRSSDADD